MKTNNLKNINLRLPLGLFNCITGVSGSGKSSLIIDTVYPYISNILNSVYDDGANISFLLNYHELTSDPTINLIIRVNERGAGWTKSCGSAASAAGAFCIQNFLKDIMCYCNKDLRN